MVNTFYIYCVYSTCKWYDRRINVRSLTEPLISKFYNIYTLYTYRDISQCCVVWPSKITYNLHPVCERAVSVAIQGPTRSLIPCTRAVSDSCQFGAPWPNKITYTLYSLEHVALSTHCMKNIYIFGVVWLSMSLTNVCTLYKGEYSSKNSLQSQYHLVKGDHFFCDALTV